jgi:hypothetical protein
MLFSMGSDSAIRKPTHLMSTEGARRQCSHALQFVYYVSMASTLENISIEDGPYYYCYELYSRSGKSIKVVQHIQRSDK